MRIRGAAAGIAAALVLAGSTAHAQVSPGPLARPHAELEGLRNCLRCHALGKGPSAQKCLACHTEIAMRMKEKKGYHHLAVTVKKQSCFTCHSDHAGEDYQMVRWPGGAPKRFDHRDTGWPLTGAHRKTDCRKCHRPRFLDAAFRRGHEHVDPRTTYLGLDDACISCHFDEHRGQVDRDCTRCHDTAAWKPVPGFDHARTKYPLTGAHARVACAKCHPVETDPDRSHADRRFMRFRPLAHDNCTPCHQDPHAGRLGSDCARCHVTRAWNRLRRGRFDHSKTRFPLRGRHAKVACEKCHRSGSLTARMRFERCTDCHDDAHAGQFARRADGGACEPCHTENGFRPSTFTLADHARTKYPLEGAHLAVPCERCHQPFRPRRGAPRTMRFRFADTACASCHDDPHAGQFLASKPKKTCERCHRVEVWEALAFDHDRDSRYPLEGEHRSVACDKCHPTVREHGKRFVRYRPLAHSCADCHTRTDLRLRKD